MTFASGLCLTHGGYIGTSVSAGCPHCPQPRTNPMPDLRTPAIRLADALDRIAELEGCVMKNAESFQKVLDVAMRAEDRIDELEAENKRLATLLADRENAAPPQPPSAPQTARALHRYPDSPEVHTGLWRALRAGRGQVR